MDLPGIHLIGLEKTNEIDALSNMIGASFLEEGWTQVWLSALDAINTSPERKLAISQAIIKCNFTIGAPYKCVYALDDHAAAVGGYLSSDLDGRIWSDLEDEAVELLGKQVLTPEERGVLTQRAEEMKPISNFSWMQEEVKNCNFIHFFAIGVDPCKRGRGAARRIITPFLDYTAKHNINCYLECYSDKTEKIYSHFGFETVLRFSDPAFDIVERCMIKYPSSVPA